MVEILGKKCGSQGKLDLDKGFSDALRDYARRRWPAGTAKLCAREWNLTPAEGRGIVEGTASKTTVEKCIKRGGLLLGILLLEEVTGQRLADLHREIGGVHEDNIRKGREVLSELLPMGSARRLGDPLAGLRNARDHRR